MAKIWLSIWAKNHFIWAKNSEQILGWRPADCTISAESADLSPRDLWIMNREYCGIGSERFVKRCPHRAPMFFVFMAYAGPTIIRHFYLETKSGFKERGIQDSNRVSKQSNAGRFCCANICCMCQRNRYLAFYDENSEMVLCVLCGGLSLRVLNRTKQSSRSPLGLCCRGFRPVRRRRAIGAPRI